MNNIYFELYDDDGDDISISFFYKQSLLTKY